MEKKDNMHLGANPYIFLRAKELRYRMTDAEIVLWEQLKNRKLRGLKFRNQHPILKYILDFYCHEHKLGIEIDGGIHNSKTQEFYDEDRTENLKKFGIAILRFTNEEIFEDVELVKKKILESVGTSKD